MKLWKSAFITSIALTSLNAVAVGSLENLSQSAKYSALAASVGAAGSGQVAVSAIATPIMLVSGGVAEVSRGVASGTQHIAEEANVPVPFEIGDEVIVGAAH
ncbi:hypothetical protein OAG1_37850 [Agarivorans sp. OAG1]|uniref:hypothetical protein n=1 Tax=unclassified Agarivorans TaxID=2636026 RepID=UPI002B2BE0C5|nr:hypothetical protein OAG1_37850 [Agarivorans sp. OAG1]